MMMFLSQLTFSIINLLFYLTIGLHIPIPMSISLLFEVSRYVTDFICLSPSWILLIICKALRMKVIPIYCNMGLRSGDRVMTKVSTLNTITR
uniref:Ovule protein n=1 Tax=Acrobeloides nanus TaxID=290746 RepID=A0A914DAC7_9BILA